MNLDVRKVQVFSGSTANECGGNVTDQYTEGFFCAQVFKATVLLGDAQR